MIISGSPQSKVFFLGKVDFEPNITVKHDIKTVIYKVNQKFDHHTQPTNLLGLFSQIKPFFLLLGELNPITWWYDGCCTRLVLVADTIAGKALEHPVVPRSSDRDEDQDGDLFVLYIGV